MIDRSVAPGRNVAFYHQSREGKLTGAKAQVIVNDGRLAEVVNARAAEAGGDKFDFQEKVFMRAPIQSDDPQAWGTFPMEWRSQNGNSGYATSQQFNTYGRLLDHHNADLFTATDSNGNRVDLERVKKEGVAFFIRTNNLPAGEKIELQEFGNNYFP